MTALQENKEGLPISEVEEKTLLFVTHQAIKRVTRGLDIQSHSFNVAIADLMKLSNSLSDVSENAKRSLTFHKCLRTLCILLSPMAPHISSEMWTALTNYSSNMSGDWFGSTGPVLAQSWPKHDEAYIQTTIKTVAVMV
jgi:leucyl-tRNA synthetase